MCQGVVLVYACRHRQVAELHLCDKARKAANNSGFWPSLRYCLTGAEPRRSCGKVTSSRRRSAEPCQGCCNRLASSTRSGSGSATTHASPYHPERMDWPLPPRPLTSTTAVPQVPALPPAAVVASASTRTASSRSRTAAAAAAKTSTGRTSSRSTAPISRWATAAAPPTRGGTSSSSSRHSSRVKGSSLLNVGGRSGGFSASGVSISRPLPALPALAASSSSRPGTARPGTSHRPTPRSYSRLPSSPSSALLPTAKSPSNKLQKKSPLLSASASAKALANTATTTTSAPRRKMTRAEASAASTGLCINTTGLDTPSFAGRMKAALLTPKALQSEDSFACPDARRVEDGWL